MNGPVTYEELATLMKNRAGTPVEPEELARRSDAAFADFGLDSLGLLGIVSALENRYGCTIGAEPESYKTPSALLALVNEKLDTLATGV
jgi:minimal PKS acyl carrier protein